MLLNKAVHNGQTYDFLGEYTKYKKIQSDSEKEMWYTSSIL